MCNPMVNYFKRNQKFKRKKIHSRSEGADQSILDQEYQSTRGAIKVEHIREGASIS